MSVALQELAASIAQVGVLQPLTVRKQGGGYLVVSGNRRLMAARMAGLGEVPCLLLEVDETDGELIGLTENLQREDLHYFEEAECLERYLVHSGFTQAQAAKQLGRSQSAIANKLRLLHHSPRVREALRDRGLSERHARELLRVPGEQQRLLVVAEIGERHLSVAQTERYIDALLENARAPGEKLRRRDARLLLERVARDATSLRGQGVAAQLQHQPDRETLVLTVTLGNCEKPKERP
jgi:ParB family chromosome partitioning protein